MSNLFISRCHHSQGTVQKEFSQEPCGSLKAALSRREKMKMTIQGEKERVKACLERRIRHQQSENLFESLTHIQ